MQTDIIDEANITLCGKEVVELSLNQRGRTAYSSLSPIRGIFWQRRVQLLIRDLTRSVDARAALVAGRRSIERAPFFPPMPARAGVPRKD
jgi:hypothetical protein